ncbi:NUDIX domain-containing protein [Actinoplanes friuliensis]|uniref:ADP-ribose pyrophosphatase n=1 Tax=Actinoplanes friuliensis DSM 7358 TaxID=1246995 RepID=U5VRN5_9ACTN|nr:NUDIX domain-containing protein [Actinoplanes friuliensis]AGZ39608.1 ADP-ribose pyrophosphatase [Actinoplanes friuliensis DSM 7358]
MSDVTGSVERVIRGRIKEGIYPPGGRLPSERTLSAELGAGRTTIRLVLGKLAVMGLIQPQHGRGYFVTSTMGRNEIPLPEQDDTHRWQVFGARPVYESPPWIRVDLVDVQPPGGMERFEHHVVRLFTAAIGLVIDDSDRVLMLWRHRFVSDQWGWELPGGIVSDTEDGQSAAAREIEEETGWRPNKLTPIISFQPMIGMVDSPHKLYYSRGATFAKKPDPSDESGEVAWIPLTRVRELLEKGQIIGAGSIVGLLHFLAFGPPKLN